jgi:Tfp pilus assembly protein PilF
MGRIMHVKKMINTLVLSATLLLAVSQNSHAGSTDFQLGIRHFEQKNYQQAITRFKLALAAGDTRAAVYYNLAVSEYRTGDFDDAARHFRQARNNPKLYAPSTYSLGLIATRRNQLRRAVAYFKSIRKQDAVLYQRARNMIARIDKETSSTTSKNLLDYARGSASITLGNDSNVNRASDNSPSNVGDGFISLYLSGKMPFSLSNKNLGFGASYFNIDYNDLDSDDYSSLRGSLFYKARIANWRTRSSIALAASELGSNSFQNTLRLNFDAKRKLTRTSSIRLNLQYDNIRSENAAFDYLQGSRQRLRAGYKTRFDNTTMSVRYQLELNARDDLPTQSFSPERHTLQAIVKHKLSRDWMLKGDIAYRSSDYPAVGTNLGRDEDRTRITARLVYRLDKSWSVEGMIRHTLNNSSDALFDYNRDTLLLSAAYNY